jgi:hypothetical protein
LRPFGLGIIAFRRVEIASNHFIIITILCQPARNVKARDLQNALSVTVLGVLVEEYSVPQINATIAMALGR